eukprot:TRINITY_DN1499_c0_g2_i2.p1 TRINITY_DN1499_c0_g2~~TRINITY_DN1499_c0_g2_i2.p1  ORF type:complete len:112 (+),score=15.20 TRINITY_DN1499_c0_g2_i2:125-460(+)
MLKEDTCSSSRWRWWLIGSRFRWSIGAFGIVLIAYALATVLSLSIGHHQSKIGVLWAPTGGTSNGNAQNPQQQQQQYVFASCHGRMLLSCNHAGFDEEEIEQLQELLYASR